jgi:ABC-2 type transport system permease protein
MALIPLLAMTRKDLQLFFSDRRSVIVSFAVPIAIASFFGSIFSGPDNKREPARIAVAIIDQDGSAVSKGIVSGAQADKNLKLMMPGEAEARDAVKRGRTAVAIIIPKGFGDASGQAFFGNGEKPPLTVLYDPSHAVEVAMVRGILTQHVMEAGEQGNVRR